MALNYSRNQLVDNASLVAAINDELEKIDIALADAVSRSGYAPNALSGTLDAGGNDVINVGTMSVNDLLVDGAQVPSLQDLAEDYASYLAVFEQIESDTEDARDAALVAQTASEAAQLAAETAQTGAETAETGAVAAQGLAEGARDAAQLAETNAEIAQAGAELAESNAETAEAGAVTAQGLAEDARDAAQLAETNAETAQSGAETAETNANQTASSIEELLTGGLTSGAPIYEDTSSGLSSTSEGDYFSVPSPESAEIYIVYRHDAGPAATELGRTPSSNAIDSLEDDLNNLTPWVPVSGWGAGPLEDSDGTNRAGEIVFFNPIPACEKFRLTMRGGNNAGDVSIREWSRSGLDLTRINDIETVSLVPGEDVTLEIAGPFDGTTHLGIRNGNFLAFTDNPAGKSPITGGGFDYFGYDVTSATVDGFIVDQQPQIRLEILESEAVEVGAEPKTEGKTKPVFFAGRQLWMATDDAPRGAIIGTFAEPVPVSGRLIVEIFGGTESGTVAICPATLTGSDFSRAGIEAQMEVEAGKLCRFDTDMHFDAGQYVMFFQQGLTIARNASSLNPKGYYYNTNRLEGSNASVFTSDDLMIKLYVVPDEPAALDVRVVHLGDSIVDRGGWQDATMDVTGLGYVNGGIGGMMLSRGSDNADHRELSVTALAEAIGSGDWSAAIAAAASSGLPGASDRIAALAAVDFDSVDFINVWAGTNDFNSGDVLLGSPVSADRTTIRGAVQAIVEEINSTYPNIQIQFCTPMHRTRQSAGDNKDADTIPNANGDLLRDFAAAIIDEAKNAHSPCVDINGISGINRHNASDYIADGVHFSSDYAKNRVGLLIGSGINAMRSDLRFRGVI